MTQVLLKVPFDKTKGLLAAAKIMREAANDLTAAVSRLEKAAADDAVAEAKKALDDAKKFAEEKIEPLETLVEKSKDYRSKRGGTPVRLPLIQNLVTLENTIRSMITTAEKLIGSNALNEARGIAIEAAKAAAKIVNVYSEKVLLITISMLSDVSKVIVKDPKNETAEKATALINSVRAGMAEWGNIASNTTRAARDLPEPSSSEQIRTVTQAATSALDTTEDARKGIRSLKDTNDTLIAVLESIS